MRKRLISGLMLAVGLLLVGTAFAYIERTTKFLPALFAGQTLIGHVNRIQALTHGQDTDPVHLTMMLEAWDSKQQQRTPGNSVSGTSHVGLFKWTSTGGQFCTNETVSTGGWKQTSFTFDKIYPQPPCGPGWYKVISCSDAISYKIPRTGNFAIIGATTEDCSNLLTWSWSPNWHPLCTVCPVEPP